MSCESWASNSGVPSTGTKSIWESMCLSLGLGGIGLILGVKERLDRLFCGVAPIIANGEDVRDPISVMRSGNNCGRAGVGLDHGTSSTG